MGGTDVLEGVQRYPLDVRAEREAALLRAVAAVLALVGAAWLLALPFLVPRILALVGLVFAVSFLRRAARVRGGREQSYLELGPEGLCLSEGDRLVRVTWAEISSVRVDEDRLLVAIARRNGPPLEIESRYRGLTLQKLGSTIHGRLVISKRPPNALNEE